MNRVELNEMALEAKRQQVERRYGERNVQVIADPNMATGILAIPNAYKNGVKPMLMDLKLRTVAKDENGRKYIASEKDVKASKGFDTFTSRFGKKPDTALIESLNVSSEARARKESGKTPSKASDTEISAETIDFLKSL